MFKPTVRFGSACAPRGHDHGGRRPGRRHPGRAPELTGRLTMSIDNLYWRIILICEETRRARQRGIHGESD